MTAKAHDPLFYRKTGHGPPVVFLSGPPAPWDVLAAFAAPLAATHTCIEIAVPGNEPSGVTIPISFEDSTERVECTLRHLGIESCAFVGFSSGAYRAMAIATRRNVHATHILSLGGIARITPEAAAAFQGFAALVRSGAPFGTLAADRFLSHDFAATHPEAVAAVTGWLDNTPRDVLAAELIALTEAPNLLPALGALKIPIVVRVGALDLAAPVPESQAIVAACPTATLELVDGAGHALVYEDIAGTQASLQRLLVRHDRGHRRSSPGDLAPP